MYKFLTPVHVASMPSPPRHGPEVCDLWHTILHNELAKKPMHVLESRAIGASRKNRRQNLQPLAYACCHLLIRMTRTWKIILFCFLLSTAQELTFTSDYHHFI